MAPIDPYRSEMPETKLKRRVSWLSTCSLSEPGEWARSVFWLVLERWNTRLLKISVPRLRVGLLAAGTMLGEWLVVEAMDSGRSRLSVTSDRRRAGWRSGIAGVFGSAMLRLVAHSVHTVVRREFEYVFRRWTLLSIMVDKGFCKPLTALSIARI